MQVPRNTPHSSCWLGFALLQPSGRWKHILDKVFRVLCVPGILFGYFRMFKCACVWVIYSPNECFCTRGPKSLSWHAHRHVHLAVTVHHHSCCCWLLSFLCLKESALMLFWWPNWSGQREASGRSHSLCLAHCSSLRALEHPPTSLPGRSDKRVHHVCGLTVFLLPEAGLLNFSAGRKTALGNNFPVGRFCKGYMQPQIHQTVQVTKETDSSIAHLFSSKRWWPMTHGGPSHRTSDSVFCLD